MRQTEMIVIYRNKVLKATVRSSFKVKLKPAVILFPLFVFRLFLFCLLLVFFVNFLSLP